MGKGVKDTLCLRVVTVISTSLLSTLLLLNWTVIFKAKGKDQITDFQLKEIIYAATIPRDITSPSINSSDIPAIQRAVDLAAPLRVPQEEEKEALNRCLRQNLSAIRINSTEHVIVPSLQEYECVALNRCNHEYQHLLHFGKRRICPCFPKNLVGKLKIDQGNLENTSWIELNNLYQGLLSKGHWTPYNCVPRRRVAVIIPYRDRQRHLRAFLAHVHPILQRQMVEYRIFVVEQNTPYRFNKASLMNVGFLEAKKLFNMDCLLFHDVDTLIERDDNMLICGDYPIHFASYADRHDYKLHLNLFGSAVLLTPDMFQSVNGFSNLYFGWGAEDDDFRGRLLHNNLKIYKGPLEIARCTLLKHARDIPFDRSYYQNSLFILQYSTKHPDWYKVDGLNSIKYSVRKIREMDLFTWIHVDLEVPEFQGKTTSIRSRSIVKRMFRNVHEAFKEKTSTYTKEKALCLTAQRSADDEALYLSSLTCRNLCDRTRDCVAVEYHSNNYTADNYCYLITKKQACNNRISSENVDVYVKAQL